MLEVACLNLILSDLDGDHVQPFQIHFLKYLIGSMYLFQYNLNGDDVIPR